jgi:MFS family permease
LSSTVVVTVLPPIVAEIVPFSQRGTALGACLAFASLGGILAPLIFGRTIDMMGHGATGYRVAFLISGVFVIVAAAIAHVLMRPHEDGERLAETTKDRIIVDPRSKVCQVALYSAVVLRVHTE